MLTRPQQSKYRPLVQRAWRSHCEQTGCSPAADGAYETWYRQQLVDSCGIYTTKQASPTKDFDALMAHFAQIAGDIYWIERAAQGDEIRLRHLIRQEQVRGQISDDYINGIARNMGYNQASHDMPAAHLWKIWNALVRYNRRHSSGRVTPPAEPSASAVAPVEAARCAASDSAAINPDAPF